MAMSERFDIRTGCRRNFTGRSIHTTHSPFCYTRSTKTLYIPVLGRCSRKRQPAETVTARVALCNATTIGLALPPKRRGLHQWRTFEATPLCVNVYVYQGWFQCLLLLLVVRNRIADVAIMATMAEMVKLSTIICIYLSNI